MTPDVRVAMACANGLPAGDVMFYSIDRLDNAGIPSADHIIPELERIAVGDVIPARPSGMEGFVVSRVESERLLVLGSPQLQPKSSKAWALPYVMTWHSSSSHLARRRRG